MHSFNNKTEIYQSAMQQIITASPPWSIRWGMFMIFLFLLMIIGLSLLIRYPDVIRLPLRVSSVTPENRQWVGLMPVPRSTISKVKPGQAVLIRLKSFATGEMETLRGKISTLPDTAKDSVFMATVSFDQKSLDLIKAMQLKPGLTTEAEIILQTTNLFNRILKGLIKNANHNMRISKIING